MITYIKGNIFDSNCEALVNPVNCVGIMGAGLAKQFKEKYPNNFIEYKLMYNKGLIKIGKVFIYFVNNFNSTRIINFPTKIHWKEKSKIEYIKEGLIDLKNVIQEYKIKSIAIPKIGCGLGSLNWSEVKRLIKQYLDDLDVYVEVYI